MVSFHDFRAKIGTFAETEIVDYHLSLADQRKQTSVFYFRLQQTIGTFAFPFAVKTKRGCRFP
jgi:hypothetical protein